MTRRAVNSCKILHLVHHLTAGQYASRHPSPEPAPRPRRKRASRDGSWSPQPLVAFTLSNEAASNGGPDASGSDDDDAVSAPRQPVPSMVPMPAMSCLVSTAAGHVLGGRLNPLRTQQPRPLSQPVPRRAHLAAVSLSSAVPRVLMSSVSAGSGAMLPPPPKLSPRKLAQTNARLASIMRPVAPRGALATWCTCV